MLKFWYRHGLTLIEGVSKDSETKHELHLPGTSAASSWGCHVACLWPVNSHWVLSSGAPGRLSWTEGLSKAEGWSAFLIRLYSA